MSPEHRPYRVLFLCTGNSARSVFAEYFLKRLGGKRFEGYSAGANPSGTVNPLTVEVLRDRFHIVITVCDNARETCPVWPGQPIVAHWGVDDPAAFVGTSEGKKRFFYNVALTLYRRLQLFSALPLEQLDRLKVERLTREIGQAQASQGDSAA